MRGSLRRLNKTAVSPKQPKDLLTFNLKKKVVKVACVGIAVSGSPDVCELWCMGIAIFRNCVVRKLRSAGDAERGSGRV